jgi:hypothetical protein
MVVSLVRHLGVYQGSQFLFKNLETSQNYGLQKGYLKFHAEHPKILGANIQNFEPPGDLVPKIFAPLLHTQV